MQNIIPDWRILKQVAGLRTVTNQDQLLILIFVNSNIVEDSENLLLDHKWKYVTCFSKITYRPAFDYIA
jgi:hypothetical protein